jgi:hypothetical protein
LVSKNKWNMPQVWNIMDVKYILNRYMTKL